MSDSIPVSQPVSTPDGAGSGVRDSFIVGGNRIPFGKVGGAYGKCSNQDMMTAALDGLIARFGLQGERIGEVVGGAVLKHSADFNLMRESALGTTLDPHTPAFDLQQACATGLEAVVTVSNKIKLGQIESAIAGGVDSTSDAPIAVSAGLRRSILAASHARTTKAKIAALAKIRPGDLAPDAPRTDEPRTGLSMGEHQAITTARWGITREAQDIVALNSHHNMAEAYDDGFFDDLVTPFRGQVRDEGLRADTSAEKLAKLSPVFGKSLDTEATMTAGNSTPLSDGASTVLLSSREWAQARSLPLLARVVDSETAAVDFVHGREGLLMAPTYAVARLLKRTGLGLDDFDYFEIHEAFASVVLTTLAAWADDEFCRTRLGLGGALGEVDRSKLNVHGSSLASGHPFAATGGRIVASTAKLLAQRQASNPPSYRPARALISVCAAGGLGVAAILEAVPGATPGVASAKAVKGSN